MAETNLHTGKVILAAAGPGDAELITVKAARYLQQADVVLADRLVSEEILQQYVRKDAEVVYVGKQKNQAESIPQGFINELIVKYAKQGKLVVRLKGGDVSVFSNVLDELQTLVTNNIPYEIIPGVTAALGAAAYSGIPLTARGHSTSLRLLTCYKPGIIKENQWKDLATTDDTLVFYMSSETLGTVIDNLLKHGIASDRLIAVIEQATTPLQQVNVYNIYDLKEKLPYLKFASPALAIVGKVVALHEKFAWLPNSNSKEYYFEPVEKLNGKKFNS